MQTKTKATLKANIVSILTPLKGLNLQTGHPLPPHSEYYAERQAQQVHATPADLALILIAELDKRGFSLRISKK